MKIGLIGNPNVGKSLIFNQLTGLGVEVSNYPGTTVGLEKGQVCYQHEKFEVCDLPGIYSIEGDSDEEKLVSGILNRRELDLVVAILDAVHLERNLYLFLQVAEYGLPILVVLNMADEAEKNGISVNSPELSKILGCPVIMTAAIHGRGTGSILPAAISSACPATVSVAYDHHIEAAVRSIMDNFPVSRPGALLSLEGVGTDQEMLDSAAAIASEIENRHKMSPRQIISANRHHSAQKIADRVITTRQKKTGLDLDRILTKGIPGIPVMAAILIGILLVVFTVGSYLEGIIVSFFTTYLVAPLLSLGLPPLLEQVLISMLLGIQAGLGIAFPFIFTFYIFISVLEDSGYLTRAAFLADQAMHRVGLHGQAIIPLILGFGCTVPAVMSLRLLASRRERFIASFLVTMIPCSARTVIIAGVVAAFVSIWWALSIYLVVFILVIITGLLLSRITPGEQFGMIMEMAPLRAPVGWNVLKKSWRKISEFLVIAMPLLIVSSIILGLLQYYGIITAFQNFIEPFSTLVLGLPAFASTALIFGILRKEMALGALVVLGGTPALNTVMTQVQLYSWAVISVLFVPCISTMAVLYRQLGLRAVILVTTYTVILGISIGACINVIFG